MVLSLVKGQKIDISKNNPDLNLLHIGLDWQALKHIDIDVSAFLLGDDEKIVREEDFVFYGQPASSNDSVKLEESISSIEKQHFIINLPSLPNDVQRIAFTLTIYESDINDHTFEDVSDIQLRIVNSRRQEEMAVFPIDYSFTKESAIVLGTLYRYLGEWKFHAVGSGFFGGLADLCHEYGVEVDDQAVDDAQIASTSSQTAETPNQRFQVVQERDNTATGEVIPKPPADYVQLKRAPLVQFNESRIETLSNQSTELIQLFAEHEENTLDTPNLAPTTETALFVTETDEQDQEAFYHSLTDMEKGFFVKFANGQLSINQAKDFLKPQGLMLALFVNIINEKANEHLDDNILQIATESIVVYEEFLPLVELIKERVTNEH